jgi:hypothetical protein
MNKAGKPFLKYLLIILIVFSVTAFFVLKSFRVIDLRSEEEKRVANGGVLAKKYCASCHQYPEPSLIDKHTWETGVLPAMALQFKLEKVFGRYGLTTQSTISLPDFEDITAFYKSTAPEKLVIPKVKSVSDWAIFSLKKPQNVSRAPGNDANTTMLAYNPANKTLYSGDLRNKYIVGMLILSQNWLQKCLRRL